VTKAKNPKKIGTFYRYKARIGTQLVPEFLYSLPKVASMAMAALSSVLLNRCAYTLSVMAAAHLHHVHTGCDQCACMAMAKCMEFLGECSMERWRVST
jgi:hypothetical protein